jgi:hypothetical protein
MDAYQYALQKYGINKVNRTEIMPITFLAQKKCSLTCKNVLIELIMNKDSYKQNEQGFYYFEITNNNDYAVKVTIKHNGKTNTWRVASGNTRQTERFYFTATSGNKINFSADVKPAEPFIKITGLIINGKRYAPGSTINIKLGRETDSYECTEGHWTQWYWKDFSYCRGLHIVDADTKVCFKLYTYGKIQGLNVYSSTKYENIENAEGSGWRYPAKMTLRGSAEYISSKEWCMPLEDYWRLNCKREVKYWCGTKVIEGPTSCKLKMWVKLHFYDFDGKTHEDTAWWIINMKC